MRQRALTFGVLTGPYRTVEAGQEFDWPVPLKWAEPVEPEPVPEPEKVPPPSIPDVPPPVPEPDVPPVRTRTTRAKAEAPAEPDPI